MGTLDHRVRGFGLMFCCPQSGVFDGGDGRTEDRILVSIHLRIGSVPTRRRLFPPEPDVPGPVSSMFWIGIPRRPGYKTSDSYVLVPPDLDTDQ